MSAITNTSANASMMAPIGGPVIDLSKSQFVKLRPIGTAALTLTDNFWLPRITTNREITIPGQLVQCETTGRLDNFLRAAGKKDGPFQGIYFNDSDIYKWAEAAAYSLGTHPDPVLEADLDRVITIIGEAQQPDGYLDTFFMFENAGERFKNLKDKHEIYCSGHLIQAAVAHFRATGKITFLNIACKLADHLYDLFGPGKRVGACGHEEAEMALIELFRATDNGHYLELAKLMIDARGRTPGIFDNAEYHQDHLPFVKQTELVGHAVRHLYYCCGAADVTAELDLPEYRAALDALWEDLTQRKMYVTGGAGSRYEGESFGGAYELPNDRAYTETCAAIASVMWNWRMLNMHGDAKYADLMERTLYNAVLPGLSMDGTHYFYENPLADRGKHRRQEWFGCACCPPNVARLLASLSGYFYSVSSDGIYSHLYADSTATLNLVSGGTAMLTQIADYPWNGVIKLDISLDGVAETKLFVRIPNWADGAELTVDGTDVSISESNTGTYVAVSVHNQSVVVLKLPMPVERIGCHPYAAANMGRVSLMRGPLVYCIEQADNTEDVWNAALPDDADLNAEFNSEILGGVTVIAAEAISISPGIQPLYVKYAPQEELEVEKIQLTAIPYYAWANREAGAMQVWIPTLPSMNLDEEGEFDEEG